MELKIGNQPLSILIDPRESLSYETPKIVEACSLKKSKHKKTWLVQLDTCSKRRLSELIECCPIEMKDYEIKINLNIFLLGFYDMIIGMDWLEADRVKLDCYNFFFECIDDKGDLRTIEGIAKEVSIRQISSM